MRESDLRAIEALRDLQILDPDHPAAVAMIRDHRMCEIAEADDTVRLWDLLHHREYEVLCAIRQPDDDSSPLRVYFRRIDLD